MNTRLLSILTFLLLSTTSLLAQFNDFDSPNGSWGIGYSLLDEVLPEGDLYSPYTLLGNYTLWQRKRFIIYAEPQFTEMSSPVRQRTNYEFGVNMGLSYLFVNSSRLKLNAAIGSGPHFITINTGKQARGFIFSDNFEIGASYNLYKINTVLVLKTRYRHISNAGLQEPNGGIDNLFLIAGVGTKF